jgi:hypothetical protein
MSDQTKSDGVVSKKMYDTAEKIADSISTESNQKNSNRRKFVKSVAGSVVAASVPVTGVAAESKSKIPKKKLARFRKRIARRHNSRVADKVIPVVKKYWSRREKGELTWNEYHKLAISELAEDSMTKPLAENARQVGTEISNRGRTKATTEQDSTSQTKSSGPTRGNVNANLSQEDDVSTSASSGSLLLGFYEMDKNTSLGSTAYNKVDFGCLSSACDTELCDVQNVLASAEVLGGAWSYVRFYQNFTPPESGDYNFELSYTRRGYTVGGTAEFAFYRIKPNGSERRKVAQSVSAGGGSGNVSEFRDITFDGLNAGDTYEIGFETYCTASTAAGAGLADYYDNSFDYDRRCDPAFVMGWEKE